LKPYTIDRNPAALELLHHGVNRIGLAIQADTTSGYKLREVFTRNFGVWREGYAGQLMVFDPIFLCGTRLPGTGERPVAPVYEDGEKTVTLKGERIAEEFQELVEQYVARKFNAKQAS